MQNPSRGRWIRIRRALQIVGLCIGGLLLLQQVVSALQAVVLSEVHLRYPLYLAAAFAVSILAGGVQILGWLLVMRRVGIRLSWLSAIRGYNFSFLPRYIPGSVWGYWSRSEWLWRNHGVTYVVSNVGSALEVMFILLAGGAFSLAFGIPFLRGANYVLWSLVTSVLLLGAVFIVLKRMPVILAHREGRLAQAIQALPRISAAQFLLLLGIYVILWLCHGAMLFFLSQSLGSASTASLFRYVIVYYLAWTGGFLVLFVPAGFGIRDSLINRLLAVFVGLLSSQSVVV